MSDGMVGFEDEEEQDGHRGRKLLGFITKNTTLRKCVRIARQPCRYIHNNSRMAKRNVIASDLGLIAEAGRRGAAPWCLSTI